MHDQIFSEPSSQFELEILPKLKVKLLEHYLAISDRKKPMDWTDIPKITTDFIMEMARQGVAPSLCTTYELKARTGQAVIFKSSREKRPSSLPPYPVLVIGGYAFDPIASNTPIKTENFLTETFSNHQDLEFVQSEVKKREE